MQLCTFFEVCHFFWDILDDIFFSHRFFFSVLIFFVFLINYYISLWKESFNNNKDILSAFFTFCCRAVSIFVTLSLSEIKRYYLFLKNFKYKETLETYLKLVSLKLSSIFVMWKPLFRKWSYFGFYKTNRSKWWKNK